MYSTDITIVDGDELPQPTGYFVLVAMPSVEEVSKGGIIVPSQYTDKEKVASIIGQVISMGPDAYSGDKFNSGPWCHTGDWVVFRSYSGTKFKIGEQEFRLINDDTVEADVRDPSKILRSY